MGSDFQGKKLIVFGVLTALVSTSLLFPFTLNAQQGTDNRLEITRSFRPATSSAEITDYENELELDVMSETEFLSEYGFYYPSELIELLFEESKVSLDVPTVNDWYDIDYNGSQYYADSVTGGSVLVSQDGQRGEEYWGANFDEYITDDATVEVLERGKSTVKLQLSFTPNNSLDFDTIQGISYNPSTKRVTDYGVWTSVYDIADDDDNGTFSDEGAEGAFLLISEEVRAQNVLDIDGEIIDSYVWPMLRGVRDWWLEDNGFDTDVDEYDYAVADSDEDEDSEPNAIALGDFLYAAFKEDPSAFQGTASLDITLTIGGLEPGTTYYTNIKLNEDGDEDSAWSKTEFFQTMPESADPQPLDQNYDGVSAEVESTSQTGIDFLGGVYCLRGGLTSGIDFNMRGCVAQAVNWLLYKPSSWIVAGSAWIFDTFMSFSISSVMYSSDANGAAQFVDTGWRTIRDVINILFIFALLYAAISLALGLKQSNAKRTIAMVIIIALFINFSLFLSRVIIDAGNATARLFYNSISIEEPAGGHDQIVGSGSGVVEQKSLSQGIAAALNLQKTVGPDAYTKLQESGNSDSAIILMLLFGAAINFIAAWTFIVIGFVLVIRIAMLWFAMIFSPFAFASNMIPALKKLDFIGWNKWLPEIVKQAFVAPIFLFFLYLILLFTNSGAIEDLFKASADLDFIEFMAAISIQFIIIIVLLLMAKKITMSLSGKAGEFANKAVSAGKKVATGVVVGGAAAATGGAALAARGTLGAAGKAAMNNQRLQNAKNKRGLRGYAARATLSASDKFSRSSFDARNTRLGKATTTAAKRFGGGAAVRTGSGFSEALGVSQKRGRGGYVGEVERRAKKKAEREERLATVDKPDEEVKAQTEKMQGRWDNKYDKEFKNWKEAEDNRRQMTGKPSLDEDPQALAEFEEEFKANFNHRHGERPEVHETAAQATEANLKARKEALNRGDANFLGSIANSIGQRIGAKLNEKEKQQVREQTQAKTSDYNQNLQDERKQAYESMSNDERKEKFTDENGVFRPSKVEDWKKQWTEQYQQNNKPPSYNEMYREKIKEKQEKATDTAHKTIKGGVYGGGVGAIAGASIGLANLAGATKAAETLERLNEGRINSSRAVGAVVGGAAGLAGAAYGSHRRINRASDKKAADILGKRAGRGRQISDIEDQLKRVREFEETAKRETGKGDSYEAMQEYIANQKASMDLQKEQIMTLKQQHKKAAPEEKADIESQLRRALTNYHKKQTHINSQETLYNRKHDLEQQLNRLKDQGKKKDAGKNQKGKRSSNTSDNKKDNA